MVFMDPGRPDLAYRRIASLARPGSMSMAAQQSSNVISPRPPSTQRMAVFFWSTSTFLGGVFALATMAVRRRIAQQSAL